MESAKKLIEGISELILPPQGQHHNLTVNNGILQLNLMLGKRVQSVCITKNQLTKPVEETVSTIFGLMKPVLRR